MADMWRHYWTPRVPRSFLVLLAIFISGAACSCTRQTPRSALVASSPDDVVVARLWKQTNETIARMGRPSRSYRVVPRRTALIVVDMQDAFCLPTGSIEIPASRAIVPNINRITTVCRELGIPVYWTRMTITTGSRNNGLWPQFQPRSPSDSMRARPPQALSDLKGESEIYKELVVDDALDVQVPKNRYSAFIAGSSGLDALLKAKKIDTIIITGVGTDVCCESTARDAMMLDYKVIMVSDANAAIDQTVHELTLMRIKMFFGDVVTTDELVAEMGR